MARRRPRTAVLAALLVALVATAPAQAAKTPKPVKRSLSALVKQTKQVPKAAASKRTRAKLLKAAKRASKLARGKPCKAISKLNGFRTKLGRVRPRGGKRAAIRLAALGPASLKASRALLSDKRTRKCGGGVKLSKLKAAKATVLQSDEKRLRVRFELPDMRFAPKTGGGKTWSQLFLPDTDTFQTPGQPGIPTVGRGFAIPEGAGIEVHASKKKTITLSGVDVFPAQPDPVDQDTPPPDTSKPPFADLPFTLNADAYKAGSKFPGEEADGTVLGHARDLQVGSLQIAGAQYTPRSKRLTILRSLEVVIDFTGGTGEFGIEDSPWERYGLRSAATLINIGTAISKGRRFVHRRCGEELLIITNPATLAPANTLRTARSAAGIRSNVFQTGVAPGQIGTTNAQIRDFIRGRLALPKGCVRPSYVAIIGDDELVPTFPNARGTIPSDLEYSLRDAADELPDLAVGRIFGGDLAQVQRAVDKIVQYENSPPGGAFLTHALVAAQFQDDDANGQENRTFITFAETVRNGLTKRGVNVDRIYTDSPTTTPQKFQDGTDLPAALKKPTFPWTGTGADITASWNAGTFLTIHRDHGYSDGWSHPGFTTTDANALTNGNNLPVVMSINCSSAAYDYDETSFAQEALTRAGGGAVGVFGDTRDSPSTANTQMSLGFVDGLLPSVLPAEGPALPQRVGDALVNGKMRLVGIAPPPNNTTRDELYLWHYFGDPTMQMWGGGSNPLDLSNLGLKAEYVLLPPDPPPERPQPPYGASISGLPAVLNSQPISLLRNGEVVGKAFIVNGAATIPAVFGDGNPTPGSLEVAFEGDGAIPIKFPVTSPKAQSTLTQTCPESGIYNKPVTVTGNLAGPPAGSQVTVKYTIPIRQTTRVVEHTVTTDAQGNWSDSQTPSTGEGGGWTIESRYTGNDDYAAATAGPCTVPVIDNS